MFTSTGILFKHEYIYIHIRIIRFIIVTFQGVLIISIVVFVCEWNKRNGRRNLPTLTISSGYIYYTYGKKFK